MIEKIINNKYTINTTMTITIMLNSNIGIVGFVIVIEINKRNINKINKIFKYMTIRTNHNLTTIRSSSQDSYMTMTDTITILWTITMALRNNLRSRMMVIYMITLLVMTISLVIYKVILIAVI